MLVINPSLYGKTLVAFACYAANKKGDRSRPFLQPKLLAALLPNMTALRPDGCSAAKRCYCPTTVVGSYRFNKLTLASA